MIDNVMKMNIEEFRQQVKELSVEQHLLLSGWVYGFTDQAHKKIHDLLADEKPLPVDFKGEVILYTNPSPAQRVGSSVLWAPLRPAVWIFTCRS